MSKAAQRVSNATSAVLDMVLVSLAMGLAYWLRFNLLGGEGPIGSGLEHVAWAALFSPVYVFLYSLLGLYNTRAPHSTMKTFGRLFVCNTVAMMLFIDFVFLFRMVDVSRILIVAMWALTNLFSCTKAAVIDAFEWRRHSRGLGQKRVVVIGSGSIAQTYMDRIAQEAASRYRVVGVVEPHGDEQQDVRATLERITPDEVVIALESDEYGMLDQILYDCESTGTQVFLLPNCYRYVMRNASISQKAGLPLIGVNRITLDNTAYALIKRGFDIVGSLVLIVISSPIMAVAAVGTKLSSPGPVLFKQTRIGRGRQPFEIYKFRSMRMNDTSDTAWTTGHDPRRTRFGTFMRRYSIDELPQLFNVLKGDMSLVGPRPEIPQYVEHFKCGIPLYMVRHQVRPGMTGWAQVNGLRGDTSIEKRVEYDLYYIENWSIMFDLRILLMTPLHGVVNKEEQPFEG